MILYALNFKTIFEQLLERIILFMIYSLLDQIQYYYTKFF